LRRVELAPSFFDGGQVNVSSVDLLVPLLDADARIPFSTSCAIAQSDAVWRILRLGGDFEKSGRRPRPAA
jgi:hypothetical protein